jgi:hypothetical protein
VCVTCNGLQIHLSINTGVWVGGGNGQDREVSCECQL